MCKCRIEGLILKKLLSFSVPPPQRLSRQGHLAQLLKLRHSCGVGYSLRHCCVRVIASAEVSASTAAITVATMITVATNEISSAVAAYASWRLGDRNGREYPAHVHHLLPH